MEKARYYIEKAQEVERNNRYLTDLLVIISIKQGDIVNARKNLAILEKLDKPEFFHHRASTVEYADFNYGIAYEDSKKVMESTTKPTFAMLSQLIKVEIATDRLEDALIHINRLESRFKHVRSDIKIGLKCKWEIASGEFRNALALWGTLKDKSSPVHKYLKKEALSGLLRANSLSESERVKIEAELVSLNAEFTVPFVDLDVELER